MREAASLSAASTVAPGAAAVLDDPFRGRRHATHRSGNDASTGSAPSGRGARARRGRLRLVPGGAGAGEALVGDGQHAARGERSGVSVRHLPHERLAGRLRRRVQRLRPRLPGERERLERLSAAGVIGSPQPIPVMLTVPEPSPLALRAGALLSLTVVARRPRRSGGRAARRYLSFVSL